MKGSLPDIARLTSRTSDMIYNTALKGLKTSKPVWFQYESRVNLASLLHYASGTKYMEKIILNYIKLQSW